MSLKEIIQYQEKFAGPIEMEVQGKADTIKVVRKHLSNIL